MEATDAHPDVTRSDGARRTNGRAPATASERFVALLLDSIVANIPAFLVAMLAAGLAGESLVGWGAGFVVVMSYFALAWGRGQSIGLKSSNIRMVGPAGARPGVIRAAVRAIFVVPVYPALLVLAALAFSDALTLEGHPNTTDWSLLLGSFAVVVSCLLVQIPLLRSGTGVPLHDRVSGIRVVKEARE